MSNSQSVDWSAIPSPTDDGATSHLQGLKLPSVNLMATDGSEIDISSLGGRTCLYVYPMTGQPGTALPDGWDMIPGARGCTPQSCSFRDHAEELGSLGVRNLYGLSTQESAYQQEAALRLHLPFSLLSDVNLELTNAINLPVMVVDGMTLLKRLAMIVDEGVVVKVFYPVFPPDSNAIEIINWLKSAS